MDFLLDAIFGYSPDGILEIYSVGGGEYLRLVFTGVSNLVYDPVFNVLLAIVAMTGYLVVLAQGAANPKRFNYMWLFILAAIYYGAILPRTRILVTDTIVQDATAVVEDVPLVVALPAAFFSSVSMWFTREVETQFSLPRVLTYSNSGFMLGHDLLADMNTMRFPDQRVADNYAEFWRTCVFYDIALERYRWEDVVNASESGGQELINFIGQNTSRVRSFSYKPATGDSSILVCRPGWNGVMMTDLQDQARKMYRVKQRQYFPFMPDDTFQNELDAELGDVIGSYAAAMPAALSYYTNISQNAAQLANTTILGNSLRQGLGHIAGSTDVEAATQEYALSKAQLERNNSFAVMGRVAGKFLPILKNVFEALVYAVTPIVILMLVLPVAGKVFMGYVKVLAWINLWNPFYALLHCVMSFYSSSIARGVTNVEQDGNIINALSIINSSQLSQTMSEHALLAGYLSLSVPMMAWMVVSMSGAMMAGLASRTMQGYDGSVQRASTEITSGNIKMGSLDYGNSKVMQDQLAPTTDSHRASWYDPTTGMERTMDAGGRQFSTQARSDYISKVDIADSVSRVARENLSEATSRVSETSSQVMDSASALRSQLNSYAQKSSSMDIHSDGHSISETGAFNTGAQKVNSGLSSFAETLGLSKQETQAFVDQHGVKVSGSAGLNLPLGGVGSIGASVGAEKSMNWSETEAKLSTEQKQKVQQYLSGTTYTDGLEQTAAGMHMEMGGHVTSAGTESENRVSSALDKMKSASQSHGEALQELKQAQYVLENAASFAATIKTESDDEINAFAASRTHDPLSHEKMDTIRSDARRGGKVGETARQKLANIQDDFVRSKMGEPEFSYRESAGQINAEGGEAVEKQWQGGQHDVKDSHGGGSGGGGFREKQQQVAEQVEGVTRTAYDRIQNPGEGQDSLPEKDPERQSEETYNKGMSGTQPNKL